MCQLEAKYMPLKTRDQENSLNGITNDQRKDQISHFILRLGFCRTEDLRRWFLTQECHLLKFRLDRLSDHERAEFMRQNDISFEQLSHDAKQSNRSNLIGLAGIDEAKFPLTTYYK